MGRRVQESSCRRKRGKEEGAGYGGAKYVLSVNYVTVELLLRVTIDKGYTSYPYAKILDVSKGVVYLLKKRLEEHRQLEQRWVADGLSVLWNTYMITGKFKQDQALQRQYQDLYQRALAADHEPQYEDTSPASPDSDVERDDVSWYDSDSADEEGEEEDAEDGQQSGQTVLEEPTTLETLMEID